MKIKSAFLFLCFYFSFNLVLSQTNNNVFDIARKGTVEQAKEKVKENANCFNVVNEEGYTPFLLACYRSNNEVAKYLMDIGCDVNSKSKFGTPLMACIVKSNNEIAKQLIYKKVDLDFSDLSGMTALVYAINFKNYEIVSALVKAGANIDYKDGKGKTALDYAILMDDDLLIELLKNKNKKL